MDKLVPDNILPKMWIIFTITPSPEPDEDDHHQFIITMVRMPDPNPTHVLVPNIFLNTPFYVQHVSLPLITGYFVHSGTTPITYDVYKYRIYKCTTQVVSLYKEEYARNFIASTNHSIRTLQQSLPFQPSWLIKTRNYKILERILYEKP